MIAKIALSFKPEDKDRLTNLCILRDALKIISDRQKKDKEVIGFAASLVEELLATVKQGIQMSANREDKGLADKIHKLKDNILGQLSEPQHKKAVRTSFQVTHDLTTNSWWLVGVGIVLFFLVFFLIVQIYDQSKEIRKKKVSWSA